MEDWRTGKHYNSLSSWQSERYNNNIFQNIFLIFCKNSSLLVVARPGSSTKEGPILGVMSPVTGEGGQLTRLCGHWVKQLYRCGVRKPASEATRYQNN